MECIYRPPEYSNYNKFLTHMFDFLRLAFETNTINVICGDFNINLDNKCIDRHGREFSNVIRSFGLNICITEYTRTTDNSKTIIDNILCNIDSLLLNPTVINCDISDHFLQHITYNYELIKDTNFHPDVRLKRSFNNENNIAKFNHLTKTSLENCDFLNTDADSNSKFEYFYYIFLKHLDYAFPSETLRNYNQISVSLGLRNI